jgi:hypothetical protein
MSWEWDENVSQDLKRAFYSTVASKVGAGKDTSVYGLDAIVSPRPMKRTRPTPSEEASPARIKATQKPNSGSTARDNNPITHADASLNASVAAETRANASAQSKESTTPAAAEANAEYDSSTGAYGSHGLFVIRRIVGVTRNRGRITHCLVEWEGNNPATGQPWQITSEPASNIPAELLRSLRRRK